MTRLLLLDLVWTGYSGWVVWNTEPEDPIEAYGQFKPKFADSDHYPEREAAVAVALKEKLVDLILEVGPDYIGYERTDWQRDLRNSRKFNADYAIERQAQRTLYSAQTTLFLALDEIDYFIKDPADGHYRVFDFGAADAKHEFGVGNKKAAAEALCQLFPERFEFLSQEKHMFMLDKTTGKKLPHHVSDAMMIGYVMSKRLIWKMLD